MKTISLETTNGSKVEINPSAISEIVEKVKGTWWRDGEYEVILTNGDSYRLQQKDRDILKAQMSFIEDKEDKPSSRPRTIDFKTENLEK